MASEVPSKLDKETCLGSGVGEEVSGKTNTQAAFLESNLGKPVVVKINSDDYNRGGSSNMSLNLMTASEKQPVVVKINSDDYNRGESSNMNLTASENQPETETENLTASENQPETETAARLLDRLRLKEKIKEKKDVRTGAAPKGYEKRGKDFYHDPNYSHR